MARCVGIEPCTLVMDLEGTDGRERGEVYLQNLSPVVVLVGFDFLNTLWFVQLLFFDEHFIFSVAVGRSMSAVAQCRFPVLLQFRFLLSLFLIVFGKIYELDIYFC